MKSIETADGLKMQQDEEQSSFEATGVIPTPFRLLIITAVSIFLAEALVMILFSALPPLSPYLSSVLDASLLSALVFPVLYVFLFRPMVRYAARHRQAEEMLRKANDELGIRVAKRTSELAMVNEALRRDIIDRKKTEEEREKLLLELQETLSKVKTLSGMLPICASCKKIRNDKGYWAQIEHYVMDHSDATFSHGLCPVCTKEYFLDNLKKA